VVGSVAATPDGAYLYVNEFQNSGSGLFYIAEFTIDPNTGDITHTVTIQVANNGGLQVDPTGSLLAVAGYSNRLPENGTPKLSLYKIASDGSGVYANGLAASPDGSRLYASDGVNQNIAWYSVNSTGTLTLLGSTAPNTIVVFAAPHMMVDRSRRFLYSTACNPNAPPPGCEAAFWGGTIGSDGSVTPMKGVPFLLQIFQWDIVY